MSQEFDADQYWLERAKTYAEHEARYTDYLRFQEQFLFDVLRQAQVPMQRVIELGCGSGRITKRLVEHYPEARVLALDLSADPIENARRRCAGTGNIRFEQHDFHSNAPLPGTDFDTALVIEFLLYHPRTRVRALIERLSGVARHIVSLDWSEAWPWKRPEHVWIHDYQAVYAEAGLNCATFVLPEKIEGMQQKLFIASKRMTPEMIRLKEMAEEAARDAGALSASPTGSDAAAWADQLHLAMAEILEFVPAGSSFILVNDDQWGNENELIGRRVIPFLEREGRYWGPPDGDQTAIRELERLREAGADYIIFAWQSFWWLDYYQGLKKHLQTTFPCLLANERLVVFGLNMAHSAAVA
jgi:SAM-dependent methyltransferase